METKDFSTAAIVSLSTGVLLCNFSDMHEAAEYLMGHPIWTHHFADKALCGEMKKIIAAQCPGMPMELPDTDATNYLTKLAEIEAEIGKTVRIRKGGGMTAMLPTDGIPNRLKDSVILVDVPTNKTAVDRSE